LNQAETAVLESRLRRDGYRVVEFGEPTDLLVVNTCSVTEDAERTCRYVIRKTLRQSPDAFIAVTGCYAQTGSHDLRSIPGIDLIVGNQFKWDLPSFLPSPEALKKRARADVLHTRTIDREDFVLPAYGEPDSTRPLLKIQDGCNVMCSFCLIPFARGHERSRLVDDVIREATLLVEGGYKEVVLTGVNIGQYRQGSVDLVGAGGVIFGAEQGARELAARPPRPDLAPDPGLPDDTRLWAALQQAGGGAWGGCVYDVDAIVARLGSGATTG
jgi:threonylcarbamoyladenosine tRNA methylthiotransferase MtaB